MTDIDYNGEAASGHTRAITLEGDAAHYIATLTRHVPDFPKEGVVFADLTPVLADPAGLRAVLTGLAQCCGDIGDVDLIAGIDARGFLLASGVALATGVGVLAVRKAGKLPPPVLRVEYELEYGTAALEIPDGAINLVGKKVLVVDDVLATGGSVGATVELLRKAGADVCAIAVMLELTQLGGRAKIGAVPFHALATG